MAVPTITSVTPASGAAWGRDVLRIIGTGFADNVSVTFGGTAGTVLGVVSDDGAGGSYLDVRTPRCPDQEPGAVDVALQNLDADGAAIDGELVTLADGYTYQRADTAQESTLAKLVRELIRSLKQQVLVSTGTAVHIDYDPDAGDDVRIVPIAETPSITIQGPSTRSNRFLQRKERRLEVVAGTGGTQYVRRGPTMTVDLVFGLTLVTESTVQLLNLQTALAGWLNANPWIYILDSDSGAVRWPMDPGEIRTAPPGPDKLRSASAEITIRGFHLDEGFVLDRGRLVEEVLVDAAKME